MCLDTLFYWIAAWLCWDACRLAQEVEGDARPVWFVAVVMTGAALARTFFLGVQLSTLATS